MQDSYPVSERREFARLPFSKPLAYKVCKKETLSMLLEGYTVNISSAGLLCTLKDKVNLEDILWLSFDKSILIICSEMEKKSLIYQNGVIGKVVRINESENQNYDVGIKFITRVEKDAQEFSSRIAHLKDEET
jgi:c-di-GMP-binding flagellar brake protein YcgR